MGNILKLLSFAMDIARGIGIIFKRIANRQAQKKDEKEESNLEKILDSHDPN